MRLGLVSDTHDRLEPSRLAARFLRESAVDRVLHLGDITTPEGAEPFLDLPGIAFLRGNNDMPGRLDDALRAHGLDSPLDRWRETLEGVSLGATHGDRRMLLDGLVKDCDVVLRGHSHVAGVARVRGALMVNPGALHRTPVRSVAILDLPSLAVAFFEVRSDAVVPWRRG